MTLEKIKQHILIAMEALDCIPASEFAPVDAPVNLAYNNLEDAISSIDLATMLRAELEVEE